MLLKLVRPVKRSGSSVPYFVQRIPTDVRASAIGRTLEVPLGNASVRITITPRTDSIRFSLRTRDPAQVKIRQAQAAAHLEMTWQALRQKQPAALSNRQATALAGELYRAWADEERGQSWAVELTPQGWVPATVTPEEDAAAFKAAFEALERIKDADDPRQLEATFGTLIDRLLLAKGIPGVDAESRARVLHAFYLALRDAFAVRERNAGGDYSPDPKAERFPEWKDPVGKEAPARKGGNSKATLTGLVEDWWQEAKAAGRKPSTYGNYRNTTGLLVKFLRHDDAPRVTPDDILRFKDHRLATINPRTGKTISARTVMDNDLAGLKTVFDWAVTNRRLQSNPAKGIHIKVGKAPKLRSKGFTEDEAVAILRAASNLPPSNDQPQTRAAKRWVPWLCAYTGARVGEIAQLRKQDVSHQGGHWVIRITPEAGTVKTNEARTVPLHAHLIEQGFADFVKKAPSGHLFLRPADNGDVLGPLQGVKNRLAAFARGVVADPNVAPNHGWRHRFKTVGMEAGIDPRILDAIQGQAPRSVAESYGDVTVKTMAAAIGKLTPIATN
ncbi:MAG: tyrosine-type recombinase/integrase [Methylovirgula sp.]|nr:tyrosine-type recombinase/integrase [Methylovirgula sp.]